MRSSAATPGARAPILALAGLALAVGLLEAPRVQSASAALLAGLGALALGRALGLRPAAAALAAAAFALSAPVARAGGPGAAAWLPWVLLGLERARRPRPAAGLLLAALAQAALLAGARDGAAALAGSLAALAWCLLGARSSARAARLGLGALVAGALGAFLAGALPAWPSAPAPLPRLDLVALGLTVLLAAAALGERRAPARAWARGAALGLAAAAFAAWMARRGLAPTAGELVAPGLVPPSGDVAPGPPVFALGLALALLLAPPAGRARELAALAALALGVALAAPGVGDLWRLAPLLGDADPRAAAGPAALFLALAAGAALELAPPRARVAGGAALVALTGLALVTSLGAAAPSVPADPPDEVLRYRLDSGRVLDPGRVLGDVDAGLPVERLRLELLPLDGVAPPRALATAPERGEAGARFEFELPRDLEPGAWLLVLHLEGEEDRAPKPLGTRVLGARQVAPGPLAILRAALALALALLLLAVVGRSS